MRHFFVFFLLLPLIWAKKAKIHAITDDASVKSLLRSHAEARAELGLPSLTYNSSLAAFAASNGARISCEAGKLLHTPPELRGKRGENLASASFHIANAKLVRLGVKGWVDEKDGYDLDSNKCNLSHGSCGHYTQMIWDETTEVGCAIAHHCGPNGISVLACNYAPAGNVCGWRPINRTCKERSVCLGTKLAISPCSLEPCRKASGVRKLPEGRLSFEVVCTPGHCEQRVEMKGRRGGGSFSKWLSSSDGACPKAFFKWPEILQAAKEQGLIS